MAHAAELAGAEATIFNALRRCNLLDAAKLEVYRESKLRDDDIPERIIVRAGIATERDIASAYAAYLSLPLMDAAAEVGANHHDLARLLPEKICRDQLIAPIAVNGEVVDLAFATPSALLVVDEVQLLTGLQVRPVVVPLSLVGALIECLYSHGNVGDLVGGTADFEQVDEEGEERAEEPQDEILHLDQPPPPGRNGRIIRMVNQILEQAMRAGASDIHLEPYEDSCKIRLRVDGILQEMAPPSRAQFTRMISRFKILAKMDIAEKRIPLDGAISMRSGDRRVDLRVSTVPTVFGEKMVMRLLDKGAVPLQLTSLGLDERQARDLIESIHLPHGLMLVTGPTGSGKSTTLYSCLNLLNDPRTNICTVEDPVEYKFSGMNQVQVKAQVGLNFTTALRAFLRQDPDVIMVGEVRDQETAQICLRAALTGHFVLSTIHTNDSLSAVTRLVDMGIEPFLLASTLRVLEAQRLVRRLCKSCREPYRCDLETARRYGLEPSSTLYRPKGCDACRGAGYRGRVGIFEVVRITSTLARLIQSRAPLTDLREAARSDGMKLLIDSAVAKACEGLTSLEAALSVTTTDDA
ncbi:GspE/PulE family protein [Paludisphaera mucosa]|uniref:GspE/PulE family protein n=1 Tax=Paludisphaera mucosa TaxID=3030827 RepID=A0ABT6FK24_9BACT|nr:GspE/PulE family protein [Paludisphaera mucosa]MDG3007708.1 GspE/PulE family protein [Paludisphaera mucosa]